MLLLEAATKPANGYGFLRAGSLLGAERRAGGDGALALQVFPGLTVEVILWEADEEFPAQVSFTVPSHLDHFWQLDAVLGLMGLVGKEVLRAADQLPTSFDIMEPFNLNISWTSLLSCPMRFSGIIV
jgi:hypothetical protein